jgi:hypothetical protein
LAEIAVVQSGLGAETEVLPLAVFGVIEVGIDIGIFLFAAVVTLV